MLPRGSNRPHVPTMPERSPRKRKRKRRTHVAVVPARVKLLVVLLFGIALAGITLVKLFETPAGRVILVDLGFSGYYHQVQAEMDDALRAALRSRRLDGAIAESVHAVRAGGRRVLVRAWDISCPPPCGLVETNLALSRAARGAGGVVRSSVEVPEPRDATGLRIEFGTRKYATHRLFIHPAPEAAPPMPGPTPPRIALVIDDFGYSKNGLIEAFFNLDLPLTLAVIPSLRHTAYAIAHAREMNKEPILHLPMEALDYRSDVLPIGTAMSDAEITRLLGRYLAGSPGVVGVNNHLGSRATADPRVMQRVLAMIKAHGLFYLDSLTSDKSIAYNTARQLGVPTARNDLFLDAETEDEAVVEERLLRLIAIARRKGRAIGIGHPKPWTYEAISRNLDLLRDSGVEFVFLSEMVD